MAQLRDALTSELIAEGTPIAIVLLADTIGREHILFDDVGLDFDPDAVLRGHTENTGNAAKLIKEAKDDEEIARLQEHVEVLAQAVPSDSDVRGAKGVFEEARSKHEPDHEDDEPRIPPNPEARPTAPPPTKPIPSEFAVDAATGVPKKKAEKKSSKR